MIGKEYKRIVEGADTAILFIHGIMGTTEHFRDLLPLVPEYFSVHNIVLDGHGKGVKDFSHTSMRKWETQTEEAFKALAQSHKNIILVGHSMGTLLSIGTAKKYPDKVKTLFLLNVPLTPRPTFEATKHSYRVLFEKVREEKPDEVAARDAYGIEIDKRLWLYIGWVPRFIELFKKAHSTKKDLAQIKAPCMAFQSSHDELVSNRSEKILRKNSNIETFILTDSTHYLYAEKDKELFTTAFINECKKFI